MARGSYKSQPTRNSEPDLSVSEMFSSLGTSLIKQATEPNMSKFEPHPKQVDFHSSTKRGRLFLGGNRSGKTTSGIIEDLWTLTKRHPYRKMPTDLEIRGRVIGDGFENGTVNEVLIPTVKRWILPSDLINGSWEDSFRNADHTLTLANGSFLEFKSYDQEMQKHAGTSRHFIHFDEEPPESIFAESMMRLVDTNGDWWITMTPLNGMNWVYEDFYEPNEEGKLKNIFIVEVASTDNPHVNKEVLDDLMQNMDPEEVQQRVEGKFAQKGGKIFPEFSEAHVMDSPGWLPPAHWRIYMSLDAGLNNPTAILWHAVSPENFVVTFKEHYVSQMIVEDHAAAIHQIEDRLGIANRVFARPADPATKQRNQVTGISILSAYAEKGIFLSVEGIPRDVSIGLDKMRMYMKPTPSVNGRSGTPHWRIVRSECPNTIKELRKLHWSTYSSGKLNDRSNKKEEVHKKDDHAFDSSRYFFTMMPDLAPDEVWKPEGSNKPLRMRTYVETLNDMNNFDTGSVASVAQSWNTIATGFSEEELSYAGLESD